MNFMLFIFIVILSTILSFIAIMVLLIKVIPRRKVSRFLMYLETVGYICLFISVGWGFINDATQKMSNDSNLYIINQKLDYLFQLDGFAISSIYGDNINNLKKNYEDKRLMWYDLKRQTQTVQDQEQTAKIIQQVLLASSTLLIAAGRAKELFYKNEE